MDKRILLIFSIGIIIISCSKDPFVSRPEEKILIANTADKIQKHQSYDDNRYQINYIVHVDYPYLAINKSQWKKLKGRGWIECKLNNSGWDAFVDRTVEDGRIVHRNMSYWVNNSQLITIAFSYYSAYQKLNKDIEPDNDTQHVMILFDNYDDIDVVIKRLQLSCSH